MDDGFLVFLCCIWGLVIVGGIGYLYYTFAVQLPRSRRAGKVLAEAGGLVALNEAEREDGVWYAGTFRNHPFAIKPTYYLDYSYDHNGRRRTRIKYDLRIVMVVPVSKPLGVIVYHDRRRHKYPDSFERGFAAENLSCLSNQAQQALLQFAQKPSEKTGFTISLGKSSRPCRLRDRATAPDGLLADEVFPTAHVIFVHEANVDISPEQLRILLRDMAAVVEAIDS
jgi:hypothetical protein